MMEESAKNWSTFAMKCQATTEDQKKEEVRIFKALKLFLIPARISVDALYKAAMAYKLDLPVYIPTIPNTGEIPPGFIVSSDGIVEFNKKEAKKKANVNFTFANVNMNVARDMLSQLSIKVKNLPIWCDGHSPEAGYVMLSIALLDRTTYENLKADRTTTITTITSKISRGFQKDTDELTKYETSIIKDFTKIVSLKDEISMLSEDITASTSKAKSITLGFMQVTSLDNSAVALAKKLNHIAEVYGDLKTIQTPWSYYEDYNNNLETPMPYHQPQNKIPPPLGAQIEDETRVLEMSHRLQNSFMIGSSKEAIVLRPSTQYAPFEMIDIVYNKNDGAPEQAHELRTTVLEYIQKKKLLPLKLVRELLETYWSYDVTRRQLIPMRKFGFQLPTVRSDYLTHFLNSSMSMVFSNTGTKKYTPTIQSIIEVPKEFEARSDSISQASGLGNEQNIRHLTGMRKYVFANNTESFYNAGKEAVFFYQSKSLMMVPTIKDLIDELREYYITRCHRYIEKEVNLLPSAQRKKVTAYLIDKVILESNNNINDLPTRRVFLKNAINQVAKSMQFFFSENDEDPVHKKFKSESRTLLDLAKEMGTAVSIEDLHASEIYYDQVAAKKFNTHGSIAEIELPEQMDVSNRSIERGQGLPSMTTSRNIAFFMKAHDNIVYHPDSLSDVVSIIKKTDVETLPRLIELLIILPDFIYTHFFQKKGHYYPGPHALLDLLVTIKLIHTISGALSKKNAIIIADPDANPYSELYKMYLKPIFQLVQGLITFEKKQATEPLPITHVKVTRQKYSEEYNEIVVTDVLGNLTETIQGLADVILQSGRYSESIMTKAFNIVTRQKKVPYLVFQANLGPTEFRDDIGLVTEDQFLKIRDDISDRNKDQTAIPLNILMETLFFYDPYTTSPIPGKVAYEQPLRELASLFASPDILSLSKWIPDFGSINSTVSEFTQAAISQVINSTGMSAEELEKFVSDTLEKMQEKAKSKFVEFAIQNATRMLPDQGNRQNQLP